MLERNHFCQHIDRIYIDEIRTQQYGFHLQSLYYVVEVRLEFVLQH